MEVQRRGKCAIITMRGGENKITAEFIQSFHGALDEVENFEEVTHLVTTGEDRFYSTGVDVDTVKSPNPDQFLEVLTQLQKLLARMITFPVVTVAAINGHCVGGGVMLALSHDYRVMRRDRGWFFMPIVKLGHTLPIGLLELAKSKVTQPALHQMVINGLRYSAEAGGKSAEFIKLVACEVLDAAVALGAESAAKGLDRNTLKTVRSDLYQDLYQILMQPSYFHSHL